MTETKPGEIAEAAETTRIAAAMKAERVEKAERAAAAALEDPDKKAAAKAAVEETKRTLDALVERIYDTQKKTGLWSEEAEDQGAIVADMHSLLSSAYIAWSSDAIEDASLMFARVAIASLGICRSMGHNVGGLMLGEVIEQARSAAAAPVEAPEPAEGDESAEGGEAAEGAEGEGDGEDVDLLAELGTDDPEMQRLLEEIEAEEAGGGQR